MWRENEIVDGTYQIIRKLGQGGTGVVFLAYHSRLQKYVVLKRIKERFTDIVEVRTEVDILKGLHHTYLPQVYDFFQARDGVYTVMDYIDGYDMEAYIKAGQRFPEETVVRWLKELLEVLSYIHSKTPPILHCDVKPANVMIRESGDVCLIDFNVSLGGPEGKLTGISRHYASPEQYRKAAAMLSHIPNADVIDCRTDIFSLGATFYHLMSGIKPDAALPATPLRELNTGYSDALCAVIDGMMERDAAKRFPTASGILKRLGDDETRDVELRKLGRRVAIIAAVWVVILIAGILLTVKGNGMLKGETFSRDTSKLISYYNEYNSERVIDLGVDILNNSDYASRLKASPSEKGKILYAIGDSYYDLEDYRAAARYYADAAECITSGDDGRRCLRDCVIANIRSGSEDEARRLMEGAGEELLEGADMKLLRAELSARSGDDAAAFSEAKEAISLSGDADLKKRAFVLCGECASRLGNNSDAVEAYRSARNISDTLVNRRRLGDACIRMADSLPLTMIAQRSALYGEAKECYESIVALDYHTLTDSMNLAVVYMDLGSFADAERLLTSLSKDEPDNYRVYMYLAFVCDKAGRGDDCAKNCDTALRLYDRTPKSQRESAEGDNIQSLRALKEKYERTR